MNQLTSQSNSKESLDNILITEQKPSQDLDIAIFCMMHKEKIIGIQSEQGSAGYRSYCVKCLGNVMKNANPIKKVLEAYQKLQREENQKLNDIYKPINKKITNLENIRESIEQILSTFIDFINDLKQRREDSQKKKFKQSLDNFTLSDLEEFAQQYYLLKDDHQLQFDSEQQQNNSKKLLDYCQNQIKKFQESLKSSQSAILDFVYDLYRLPPIQLETPLEQEKGQEKEIQCLNHKKNFEWLAFDGKPFCEKCKVENKNVACIDLKQAIQQYQVGVQTISEKIKSEVKKSTDEYEQQLDQKITEMKEVLNKNFEKIKSIFQQGQSKVGEQMIVENNKSNIMNFGTLISFGILYKQYTNGQPVESLLQSPNFSQLFQQITDKHLQWIKSFFETLMDILEKSTKYLTDLIKNPLSMFEQKLDFIFLSASYQQFKR